MEPFFREIFCMKFDETCSLTNHVDFEGGNEDLLKLSVHSSDAPPPPHFDIVHLEPNRVPLVKNESVRKF
jgi:hypothetical protein